MSTTLGNQSFSSNALGLDNIDCDDIDCDKLECTELWIMGVQYTSTGTPGAPGAAGPTGPAGASMQYIGYYDDAVSYNLGDVAGYLGSCFVCHVTPCINQTPSLIGSIGTLEYWGLLAVKGDTGPKGAKGDDGSDGAASTAAIIISLLGLGLGVSDAFAIAALVTMVVNLEGEVGGIAADVAALDGELSALSGEVTTLNGDVDLLQTKTQNISSVYTVPNTTQFAGDIIATSNITANSTLYANTSVVSPLISSGSIQSGGSILNLGTESNNDQINIGHDDCVISIQSEIHLNAGVTITDDLGVVGNTSLGGNLSLSSGDINLLGDIDVTGNAHVSIDLTVDGHLRGNYVDANNMAVYGTSTANAFASNYYNFPRSGGGQTMLIGADPLSTILSPNYIEIGSSYDIVTINGNVIFNFGGIPSQNGVNIGSAINQIPNGF